MIVPKHFENLSVLHENTCKRHAYFIPASKELADPNVDRNSSDRFLLLNGTWDFRFFESITDVSVPFYEVDADRSAFVKVPVPATWQNLGFDNHQYVNANYPFPLDPPYVPRENPCGEYLCDFTYVPKEDAPRVFLNFEGVDSCYYVWLNGNYVGYSQVTHAIGEFEVTDLIHEGKNTIAVLVLKWCDGSYMEDQDKFRTTGIIRDVYLVERPESFIRDYRIQTKLDENGDAEITLSTEWEGTPSATEVSLYDAEGELVAGNLLQEEKLTITLAEPKLWNAEEPYLYRVVLTNAQETIVDELGIRTVEAKDGVLLVNGVAVKLHGTNRHDSDPVTGPVIDEEQLRRDLLLMKQHNINAIRTSHYPNAPWAYFYYERLGFYVIDEADNESHGADMRYRDGWDWKEHCATWGTYIADNPAWTEATVDRTQALVTRDLNRACVIMWSMGNECAYGCTFEAALAWTKSYDPTRLTHYESALYVSDTHKYDFSKLDTYSRMYPSIEDMRDYLENDQRKPYVLCEYCHAMGNGPGDLEDYFRVIHSYDCACGGMIWEWCDHAVLQGRNAEGELMYGYGGDSDELLHDGNFCMDGLVYPDRRPHTGLLEFKNVHRPARIVSFSEKTGNLILHNYMDFRNLNDYLRVEYVLNCDGETLAEGIIDIPDCEAHENVTVTLPIGEQSDNRIPEAGRCYLQLHYLSKHAETGMPAGYLLGEEEILLENKDPRMCEAVKLSSEETREMATFSLEEDDQDIVIEGEGFSYRYDKYTGLFFSMEQEGRHLLTAPMEWNVWRAPTDNDANIKRKWTEAGYDQLLVRTYDTEVSVEEAYVRIVTPFSLAAIHRQPCLRATAEWRIYQNGKISLTTTVKRDTTFPMLPRFGIRMMLPEEMKNVTYYGMGPYESYVDKHHASLHGIYNTTVAQMHEDYIRPQENGSHCDCNLVMLYCRNAGLVIANEDGFSFNASRYTAEELTEAAHNYELTPSGSTVLCIDYKQNGIGSNSCGPELAKQYRFDDEAFTFRFAMECKIR